MQATRLCLLGAALALAVTCASALLTPGETFPNLKPGVVIKPNITTYTVSSQYVKARTWAALATRSETWQRWRKQDVCIPSLQRRDILHKPFLPRKGPILVLFMHLGNTAAMSDCMQALNVRTCPCGCLGAEFQCQ